MKRRISILLILLLFAFTVLPADALCSIYAETENRADRSGRIEKSTENYTGECPGTEADSRLFPYGLKGKPKYHLDDDFSMIKVLITIGDVKNITLNLHGGYYIENNMYSIPADANMNSSIQISVSSGQVAVKRGNNLLYKGSSAIINRVTLNSSAGWAQLITAGFEQNNGNKYLGNFKFTVNSGFLEMINIVPTAHYLYGIVPYEMSESNEMAALVAQAITSKTYAFAFPSYPDEEYVISDSYSYQGYRGYKPGSPKSLKACIDACGKILSYDNELLLTFYGASDGGETDLPSHVFGPGGIDHAYEIKLDDPDFEYAVSKRQTLEITYGEPPENAKFASLLNDEITKQLGHSAKITAITDCILHTPKYEGSKRNLTMMDVTMNILDGGNEDEITVSFKTELLKKRGIFTKNFLIYWGEPSETGYNVYFCRWGHGLGLSQYGAQARALRGECCEAILSFYFGQFTLSRVKEENPEEPFSYTQPVVAYGTVIKTNTTVNLRSQPSTSCDVVAKIPVGTHLDIISESNGWISCIANGMFGYIRGDYVNIVLYPSPSGAQAHYGQGLVNGSAVMYAAPSAYSVEIMTLTDGSEVIIKSEIGNWYYINFNNTRGFVPKDDIRQIIWGDIDLHEIFVPRL